ncbi:MAG: MATE family efflux transporter [Saprospiraceae bacterium]
MNKEILKLAIPNIISNISVPLLSTVDTALMGRLSEIHIGAVGVGAMIFNFVYWNFGFLRMGTTGITAQAFGKQSKPDMAITLGRALVVVLGLSSLLLVLQVPFGQLSFRLMNVNTEQAALVDTYFYIRIWAAPATLGLYAFMGWFFGLQNAVYPLILTVGINVINIILSYVMVHYWGWGVAGVAYGTLIAQYFGLILALGLFFYKYGDYVKEIKTKALLQWHALKKFLSINFDIFLRTLCLTFAFGFFYSQSAKQGELVLAANVILLQYMNWMAYGVDGFAFATESLVGKYAGARKGPETNKAIRLAFVWGMALAAGFSLLYTFAGEPLLHVFTTEAKVIEAAKPYLFWMMIFPILSTPCYIWDGVFIGLTASKAMRNCMILAILIFLGTYFFYGQHHGNHGLWLTLLLFMVARGAIQQGAYLWRGLKLR